MRFGILGPLEVRDGTEAVPLAEGRQRLLLAVLLVHAGEVVSVDRLVELLWDGDPPRTAARSLHNHVSALRKQLGDGVVETRGHGYVLDAAPEEIDVTAFDALARQGREAQAAGDPANAAALATRALDLWRGPAYGELAAEPAVQAAARRLEGARLSTVEARIDAELALGRHAELVGELEELAAAHPWRERLQGELVLALYRTGRQADALDAYNNARRRLVDELGIEPGPELRRLGQAVLEQDPALGASEALPARPARPPPASRHRPSRAVLAAGVLAAAGVAVVLAIALLGGGDSGGHPSVAAAARTASSGGDALVLDARTAAPARHVGVGLSPTDVAAGAGATWVVNADQQTITRIDARTYATKTFATGGIPLGVAADATDVWVLRGARLRGRRPSDSELTAPVALQRIDPDSVRVLRTVALPRPQVATFGVAGQLVAVSPDAVWAVDLAGWLVRLDRRTGERRTFKTLHAFGVVAGDGQVWIRDTLGRLTRLAPRTGRPLVHVELASDAVSPLAIGAGSLWLAQPTDGTVWRIDERTLDRRPIPVAGGVQRVAVGAGGAWATNSVARTIARIDPRSDRVTRTAHVAGIPRGLAVSDGRVWVAVTRPGGGAPAGGLPAGSPIRALPAGACGRVLSGGGAGASAPRLLIASDLPLTGQADATQAMADATAWTLAAHRFRAGRFTVGLQSCDDSLGQIGTWEADKCRADADAYAANPAVVGVVGPLNSGCAEAMEPILNRSARGPVALVSPANSDPPLVRPDPLFPGALRSLFPTGQRAYARVYPSDDYEAAAEAVLARRIGHGAAFVLQDQGAEGRSPWRVWFGRAAHRIGLHIRGEATWDPSAASFAEVGRRVRASGARVVVINGDVASRLGAVLAAVRRATHGRRLTLVGTQQMNNIPKLFINLHGAARTLLVASPGLTVDRLGPAGRRFVARFAATQPRHHVSNFAVYAAAATEVLLSAIARSDGTRGSVARALAHTDLRDSPLGPFALDGRGELRANPIAFVRPVRAGGDPHDIESLDGGRTETVVVPPARLVGP